MAILGFDVPENYEGELFKDAPEPEPQPPQLVEAAPEPPPMPDVKSIELGRLRRFCENGSHHDRPFTSDVLTVGEIRDVMEQYAYDFDGKAYQP